ncbi:hypothetical protein ACFWCB_24950 [Streptomyces sp. NPDC060048]|uniref:hypothetical protein n=1 Tax=unclassified Streptomyces TaxID=2593676 RepID=UPI00368B04E9
MTAEVPDAPNDPPAQDAAEAGPAGPVYPEPLDEDAGPAGPAALGVVRTPTGHAEVDAGLERLADADHLTAHGHVDVYEDVHRGLRSALTALDAPTGPRSDENRS